MSTGTMRSLFQAYRGTETSGSLSSTTTVWATNGDLWGGFLPRYLTMRSYGAGEVPAGMREIEVHGGVPLQNRDGLEVTAGPESGSKWRVIDVDEANPGRWLVRLEPFTGDFT